MGHCTPGDRLDVDDLSQRYATSVTPMRDALQMLNQEGLVAIKPRSGYFVTRITLKELRDMLDLRKILELASIERTALRITEEQINQIKKSTPDIQATTTSPSTGTPMKTAAFTIYWQRPQATMNWR